MLGTGDNPGIMALALNEIFALVRRGAENSTYTVSMSYLEVIFLVFIIQLVSLELRKSYSSRIVMELSDQVTVISIIEVNI